MHTPDTATRIARLALEVERRRYVLDTIVRARNAIPCEQEQDPDGFGAHRVEPCWKYRDETDGGWMNPEDMCEPCRRRLDLAKKATIARRRVSASRAALTRACRKLLDIAPRRKPPPPPAVEPEGDNEPCCPKF